MFWVVLSAIATLAALAAARRVGSQETLGAKQVLYLGAFCFVLFGSYSYYQWDAARAAPEEIEVYVPLYPGADLKNRIPVEHFGLLDRFSADTAEGETIRGQWIYETTDSTVEVGRFYQQWASLSGARSRIEVRMDSSDVQVTASGYSMNVTARNHWGRTRITYTLTDPVT
jgi:hypothetical protein